MSNVELQFAESEKRRKDAEEKKQKLLSGVPSESDVSLSELEQFKNSLRERMEAKSFLRFSNIIDLAKTSVKLQKEFLNLTLSVELADRSIKTVYEALCEIQNVNTAILKFIHNYNIDLADAKALREEERRLIARLNKYLDRWS